MYGNNWEPSQPLQTQTKAAYTASGMIDGFVLPILKAVTLGFIVGVFCGIGSWALKINFSPWLVWLLVWFGVAGASFIRYSERAAWLIEKICGADFNHDGYIGQPAPAPAPPMRIELIQNEGRQGDFIELPYADKIPQLASGLMSGRQFSQDSFAYILSRKQFNTIRDEMLSRGLAAWKNPEAPSQGCELSAAGRAVMKRLATNQPPTLSGGE